MQLGDESASESDYHSDGSNPAEQCETRKVTTAVRIAADFVRCCAWQEFVSTTAPRAVKTRSRPGALVPLQINLREPRELPRRKRRHEWVRGDGSRSDKRSNAGERNARPLNRRSYKQRAALQASSKRSSSRAHREESWAVTMNHQWERGGSTVGGRCWLGPSKLPEPQVSD